MADWNSLLDALNTSVSQAFGREISYQGESGNLTALKGIFQPTHESEDASPGVYGALFVRLADLPAPPRRGDAVTVDGTVYKVFDIEADGGGGAVLRLRQA